MNRSRYFINRLLLVVVSYFGIVMVTFLFTQLVPGGPLEQRLAEMSAQMSEGGVSGEMQAQVSDAEIEALREIYRLDKPLHTRFWMWLWNDRFGMIAESTKHTKPAWELISERFPVSLSFGIPSLILTYLICIPLGIVKALKDGKAFDWISSVVVFILYAIPAFAAGMILKMLFCGTVDGFWDIFPLGGFESTGLEDASFWVVAKDRLWHMVLPVSCYVMGNFAVMTLLMKNSLLEQVSQDYVRTVLAKGAPLKRAVWGHAVRNSLIPIATGIGGVLTIMFAGSVLIERVFDINGIGLLSLDAIITRDYPVFLCIVSVQSVLALLGRVLSDFCYVIIDPRIHFGGGQ